MTHAGAIQPSHPARRVFVMAVFAAAALGLLWRTYDLQHNRKDFLQTQGDARQLRVVKLPAHRGKLFDRRGEPLAVSAPVDSVWANPRELAAAPEQWSELTQLLGLDSDYLKDILAKRIDREFIYLKRHIPPELARQMLAIQVPGVYLQREYRRFYPAGEVTAHVTGFTNLDDRGQEGLELAFDNQLRGEDGSKRVLRDRLGQAIKDVESIRSPSPGQDLTLTIDRRIQYVTYRALSRGVATNKARAGSAVVIDVHTGEVLAMVNQPSYNPNNRSDRVSERYRNRAVTDVFEPGSTFKTFTIASALTDGAFLASTNIDTRPGFFKVGSYTVRDAHNYGIIDVATVLKKSSNVGASKIALAIPAKTLWQTLSRMGFGVSTGSGFPGESDGILTHFFDWRDIRRATLSFGYGLSVTPLQLAQAYAVIANGGLLRRATFRPVVKNSRPTRVLSKQVTRELRAMLESVVTTGGTGQRANVAGYRVGGKTGTVRKSEEGGYSEDRYLAVFAGMVPMSAPRVAIVVVVDEPRGDVYYGGQVAAPVFAEIVAGTMRALGIAPDDHRVVKNQIRLSKFSPGTVDDQAALDVAALNALQVVR